MRVLSGLLCCVMAMGATLMGCATTSEPIPTIGTARKPAWSLKDTQDRMIVNVSPARQTLKVAGRAGKVLGTGISIISNARHRKAITAALEGYDAGDVFQQRLATGLREATNGALHRVEVLESTAGYEDRRDAERERYRVLTENGHDLVLDLRISYGLFSFEGILIAKLKGELRALPAGKRFWENALVVSSAPILANDKLNDPTKRKLGPNFSLPRLSVKEDAIKQWTQDGGVTLRNRFESAVDGLISALVTDLGLAEEANGAYYLGKQAMYKKDFDKAEKRFNQALTLDPASLEAKNGLSVNLAHTGKIDAAIALAKEIIQTDPRYGPAHYNLAWWYATEKDDPAAARPHYKKALDLGMPTGKKIEKALAE